MTLDPLSDETNLQQFIPTQMERYNSNLRRVDELVGLAKNEKKIASDILRSAVVFLHASLEDFLRSVASILLPYSDEKTLDNIPLVGTEYSRPEKFFLGSLAVHRGKSILDVIQESVDKHLLTSTYNNKKDISRLLDSLGVRDNDVTSLIPRLETLIKRRHQIVHRADKQRQDELEPITSEQVQEWIVVVDSFMEKVIVAIASARL
jgi:hypothetical protein